jgi:hypothetical protein
MRNLSRRLHLHIYIYMKKNFYLQTPHLPGPQVIPGTESESHHGIKSCGNGPYTSVTVVSVSCGSLKSIIGQVCACMYTCTYKKNTYANTRTQRRNSLYTSVTAVSVSCGSLKSVGQIYASMYTCLCACAPVRVVLVSGGRGRVLSGVRIYTDTHRYQYYIYTHTYSHAQTQFSRICTHTWQLLDACPCQSLPVKCGNDTVTVSGARSAREVAKEIWICVARPGARGLKS